MKLEYGRKVGFDRRVRLGLIVLKADEVIENEYRAVNLPPDVLLYHSRIDSAPEVTRSHLSEMENSLVASAGLFPQGIRLNALGFACTSGAAVIGSGKIREALQAVFPGVPATNPFSAAKKALASLGVSALGLVSPYEKGVAEILLQKFSESGFAVEALGSFEQREEKEVALIPPADILSAVVRIGGSSACRAVFVSCTNLQTLPVVRKAERILKKPVLTSSQALLWHLLKLAGAQTSAVDWGMLFQEPRASL